MLTLEVYFLYTNALLVSDFFQEWLDSAPEQKESTANTERPLLVQSNEEDPRGIVKGAKPRGQVLPRPPPFVEEMVNTTEISGDAKTRGVLGGALDRSWRSAFLVLKGKMLSIYRSSGDPRPKNFPVSDFFSVDIGGEDARSFQCVTTSGNTMYIKPADTAPVPTAWVSAIRSSMRSVRRHRDSLIEGNLRKRASEAGVHMHKWKVRWFVACEKEILYYSSRDDSDPARRIPMQDVMEVGWAKRDDEGGFCACSLLATK